MEEIEKKVRDNFNTAFEQSLAEDAPIKEDTEEEEFNEEELED